MKSKSADKIKMPSIDELLGVSGEESATDIEISRIHSFANHPFKVLDDDKMDDLVESIKQNGVLTPVLVRPDKNNSYEMISGHRRMHAAIKAGLETIPAIVRDMLPKTSIQQIIRRMENSTWYVLLKRSGLDVKEYLGDEDFQKITDFNELKVMVHLGTAVNEICRPILMQLGRYVLTELENDLETVAKEKEVVYNEFSTLIRESNNITEDDNRQEKEEDIEHESNHLQSERKLSDTGHQHEGEQRNDREVRNDAERISEEPQNSQVQSDDTAGNTGRSSGSNRQRSQTESGRPDRTASSAESGTEQNGRRTGMDTSYESDQSAGRGAGNSGGYLQLSLFQTEEEQIEEIRKAAAEVEQPAAFFITDEVVDDVLRTGSGRDNTMMSPEEREMLQESIRESTQMPTFFVVTNQQRIDIKMDTYHAQLQSAEFSARTMKLGCYLFMAVVGFIGFMNMANTMIMNITTKKQEYGVLQAVGMTNKQLNLCLQLQGLIFTVGTICVALVVGLPFGYVLFAYAKHNGIFGMNVYHVPITPILAMILLVSLLQIVLSLVLSSNLKKETLVERIRYQG